MNKPEDKLGGEAEQETNGAELWHQAGHQGRSAENLHQDHPSWSGGGENGELRQWRPTRHHPVDNHPEVISPHREAAMVDVVKLDLWVAEKVEADCPKTEV